MGSQNIKNRYLKTQPEESDNHFFDPKWRCKSKQFFTEVQVRPNFRKRKFDVSKSMNLRSEATTTSVKKWSHFTQTCAMNPLFASCGLTKREITSVFHLMKN